MQWEEGHANTLNYKRGPRMDQWYHGDGYGGTMWQELASLIDIRTEDHPSTRPLRFTGGNNTPRLELCRRRPSYIRHVGQYDKYPYYPDALPNETGRARCSTAGSPGWASHGLRRPAPRRRQAHALGVLRLARQRVPARGPVELQPCAAATRDSNDDEADQLFANDLAERDDALIFAEILSSLERDRVLVRLRKRTTATRCASWTTRSRRRPTPRFNGDLGDLDGFGTDFGPNNGITYVWGHDEGGPAQGQPGYAYILTHIGFPMVYFTGNNIMGRSRPQRLSQRPHLDDSRASTATPSATTAATLPTWSGSTSSSPAAARTSAGHDDDFLALERYDDEDGNGGPDAAKALLLVALNDSGCDIRADDIDAARFPDGTVLHDYTGNNAADITVYDDGGKARSTSPCPATAARAGSASRRRLPDPVAHRRSAGRTAASDHDLDRARRHPRRRQARSTCRASPPPTHGRRSPSTPPGRQTVDSVMLKWGQGSQPDGTTTSTTGRSVVIGRLREDEQGQRHELVHWTSRSPTEHPRRPERRQVRARSSSAPGPARPVQHGDQGRLRRPPRPRHWRSTYPAEGETVDGDAVMVIGNPDCTAYGMTVGVDGGTQHRARDHEGPWKFSLAG